MRSTVIAAMTAAAITKARRGAPPEGAVMSEAVVTAALFANLAGGVNAEVSAVPERDVVASPHAIGGLSSSGIQRYAGCSPR